MSTVIGQSGGLRAAGSSIGGRIARPLLASAVLLAAHAASAQDATAPDWPVLHTNQEFLQEVQRGSDLDITDLKAVFEFVLGSLPDEVTVYPTENYYYFSFMQGGVPYAGNVRLAVVDRDDGIVHFAYFPSGNVAEQQGQMNYKPLGPEDGVEVEKLDRLKYAVTSGERTVVFNLNDLSDVVPPDGVLADNETYLGPIFDESGVAFYLVYNPDLKIFHYVLNEQDSLPEELRPASFTDRIEIGRRSGFAFYRDHHYDRRVLIAVSAANVSVNNYFDGPFDQLPDNFNKDDRLMNAINESDPTTVGRLDRYGYLTTGEGRYLIGPYTQYNAEQELIQFHLCATNPQIPKEMYPACFAIQGGGRTASQ